MIALLGWHNFPPSAGFILPHLANKLVMQLKTIHISTGTLALATFLTAARALNIGNILIKNQPTHGTFWTPRETMILVGYDSDGKLKKSGAYD